MYSADLDGLWAIAPELRFWPTVEARNAEGYLFPGLTIVVLSVVAIARRRRDPVVPGAVMRARRLLLAMAALVSLVALIAFAYGPMRFSVAGLTLSITSLRKPVSLVIVALAAWLLLHPRMLAAARVRSVLAFYVLATALMFAVALGPNPMLWDVRFFYRAPYAWLMALPGFDESLRAPARFGMLAALTLSVAAGLAWARLRAGLPASRARWIAGALAALVVVEGWSGPSAAHEVPPPVSWPRQCARLPRLELPFKGIEHDAAAQYRALLDGVRSVNGTTGFVPPHMLALVPALEKRDPQALTALAEHGAFCAAVDRTSREGRRLARFVVRHSRARRLRPTSEHYFYLIRRSPAWPVPADNAAVPISAAESSAGPVELAVLADDDPATAWVTPDSQRGSESLTLTLGCSAMVSDLALSLGGHVPRFARELAVDVSADGTAWRTVWRGQTGGRTVRAALRDPIRVTTFLPLSAVDVSRIRLRSLRADREAMWAIAGLRVLGACRGS